MVRLFVNYYKDKNPERQRELDYCLNYHPVSMPGFMLHVFTDDANRPTYRGFFEAANKLIESDDDISIIANSDIVFPQESISLIEKHLTRKMCFALTRWDNEKIQMYQDSQDCWCFRGRIVIPRYCDFFLGKPGCDNRIAWELANVGYIMKNPCLSIKTHHIHGSNIRNYTQAERIERPYLFLPHCDIADIEWFNDIRTKSGEPV